ncbi:hypothetical protein IL306_002977 [Fusarium sp. DS 682]|nr:hypothetical protein IL306_002977 [Fusarium sp. DS 682]
MSYDQVLGFNERVQVETRSLDEIYKAALKEGGTVTCWHGGDAVNQRASLKKAFETRFPGMKLNVTVDLSKYHDARLDQQLAASGKSVYVDSIILQTLQDYPRWAQEGALLNYAPKGFDQIDHAFKDSMAHWYGVYIFFWANVWNTEKLPGIKEPVEYTDWLRPEFKNKLVLTYPNDDDAVLMQEYGASWFEDLLKQNPRWVRGTATPRATIKMENTTEAAYFAAGGGFGESKPLKFSHPKRGKYVSWSQRAAILKDAPHPEGAKLLHNYILSEEYQSTMGTWSVRRDIATPPGFPDLRNETATNPTEFARFMEDRGLVERLRFWFEARIGTAQGVDPINDPINMG